MLHGLASAGEGAVEEVGYLFVLPVDFESLAATERALYQKNNYFFTQSADQINKDFSFFGREQYFQCKELRGGPQKIDGVSSLLYVAQEATIEGNLITNNFSIYKHEAIDQDKMRRMKISEKLQESKSPGKSSIHEALA